MYLIPSFVFMDDSSRETSRPPLQFLNDPIRQSAFVHNNIKFSGGRYCYHPTSCRSRLGRRHHRCRRSVGVLSFRGGSPNPTCTPYVQSCTLCIMTATTQGSALNAAERITQLGDIDRVGFSVYDHTRTSLTPSTRMSQSSSDLQVWRSRR